MSSFVCPVCKEPLSRAKGSLRCTHGHNFDVARQGYVNLVKGGGTRRGHGDDRAMIAARQAFLSRGYYAPLADAVSRLGTECVRGKTQVFLLDAGCGEGYYTCRVKEELQALGKTVDVCGIDLSREALIFFSRRDKSADLAVASIADIPVKEECADLVLNLFAPQADAEFLRITKRGGRLICVFPLQDHLMGLKRAVYDTPYENPPPSYDPQGFREVSRTEVRRTLQLCSQEDIHNLFLMTPYYYKTSRRDQEKLEKLTFLETPVSFGIYVYEKE